MVLNPLRKPAKPAMAKAEAAEPAAAAESA
jgi:hypothetical protein